jgi:BNR repeat-like domain
MSKPPMWLRLVRRTPVWLTVVWMAGLACRRDGDMRIFAVSVPSAGAAQSADPALTVDPGSGDVVAGWIEGDGKTWSLYVARSADTGKQWSAPVRVAGGTGQPDEVHPHGESSPRLVAGPGHRLALVWPNNIKVEGRKWPAAMLRFSRSLDGGQTWSRPVTLNDDTTGALVSHQFHGAALVGDSGLAVAWLDERGAAAPIATGRDGHAEHALEPDAHIYLASSPDFGGRWSPNRMGWNAACPCCRISLARGADGRAVAAWRQHFPGNVRDVVTAAVSSTPSQPQRVHPDDWAYAGCPHSGPALATAADGATHVVWYTGKEGGAGVYYAKQMRGKSTGPAVPLVSGQGLGVAHPAVAALPAGGALAGYDVSPDGKRLIRLAHLLADGSIADQTEIEGSEEGKYPQLVVVDSSTALLGWTTSSGDGSSIRFARISVKGR